MIDYKKGDRVLVEFTVARWSGDASERTFTLPPRLEGQKLEDPSEPILSPGVPVADLLEELERLWSWLRMANGSTDMAVRYTWQPTLERAQQLRDAREAAAKLRAADERPE